MSRHDRFARLSRLSLERYEVAIELDWRYPCFFDWLQVSPSYRLAHRIALGQVSREGRALPVDFEKVEQTYQKFGSVYRTYFDEWWFKTAQFHFGVSAKPKAHTLLRLGPREEASAGALASAHAAVERYLAADRVAEGQPSALLVAIPVSHDRRRVLREIAALIEQEFGPEGNAESAAIKLIDNKMRERTLLLAMRVLFARASQPKAKLYEIGNKTKIAPQYWTDRGRKRGEGQDTKRSLMEIVTARHLKRAYLLAENAARGRFPTLDPLPIDPGRPEFNFVRLQKQLLSYIEWGKKHIKMVKAQQAARKRPAKASAVAANSNSADDAASKRS